MNTNHVLKLMIPLDVAEQVALAPSSEALINGAGTDELEPAYKLHVTLAFLGKHISGDQRQVVAAVLDKLAGTWGPLRLHLGTLRKFQIRWREVVWAAVDEPTGELEVLRERLVTDLRSRGIAVDETFDAGGWTPHVTLARGKLGLLQRVVRRHDYLNTHALVGKLTYKAGVEVLEYPLRGEQ